MADPAATHLILKELKAIVLCLMGAAALALLIWGPRSDEPLPPGREHDVVVEYWEKWVGPEEQQMRQIVDDFNNTQGKRDHIFVHFMSMSDISQKTLVAIAGGVPPDICGLWDGNLVEYASLDAFEPLEDLAAAANPPIDASYYKPVYWNACHWNGHLYALVSTPAAVALHYNKKIFQENADKLRAAGLDPDRAPRTIAELDRYADVLNTYIVTPDGKRHLDRAGYLPMEPGWYINQTAYWFGASLWNPATKQFTLTDPGVIAAYKWIQSYSTKFGPDALAEYSSGVGGFNSPQNAFIAGKVVMEQQGPWMANFIHQLKPSMDHDWAAAPFPSAVPGLEDVSYCPFDSFSIPRGSKHKKEAFEFIAFVNSQKEMEKLCMLQCKNSPLQNVSDNFIKNHPNPYISVFEELSASPSAGGAMRCPIASEAGADINAMTDKIVRLEIDPETALRQTQVILQKKYESYQEEKRPANKARPKVTEMPSSETRNFLKGMAFISPWLVGFLAFTLLPVALSLYYSFCDYSLLQPPVFRGMNNYHTLLHDPIFWQVLRNSLVYAAIALPAGLIISLAVALLLNTKVAGQHVFRTIVFIPSLVPTVASAMLWLWLYNNKLGLINAILAKVGIPGQQWLTSKQWVIPSLVMMSLWGIGNTIVIYLAGLQDVPRDLYEAAELDGAGPWLKLWNVTLPMISPVIFFNLVMAIIGVLQVFDAPYIMTRGGPERASYFFTNYLYDNGLYYLKMGYASAMAWIQLLIVLAMTALAFWSSRKWVYYQGK